MSHISFSEAFASIDNKTKPPGSLGALEHWAARLIVLQNSYSPKLTTAKILLFAADHGIADEDVSQYPKLVTREMLRNLSSGGAAINAYCNALNLSLEVIDVGVDTTEAFPNITTAKASPSGTKSSLRDEAMSEAEYQAAITAGRDAVSRALSHDESITIGVGELGIGNTATASCLLLAEQYHTNPYATYDAAIVTGAGTGVTGDRLAHKTTVVANVIEKHKSVVLNGGYKDILRVMGGFEVVAMVGAIHECAVRGVPVLVDGFISQVAYLYALKIFAEDGEKVVKASFVAHFSAEKAGQLMLQRIELAQKSAVGGSDSEDRERAIWKCFPILNLGMRLGEGTGAALAFPLLKSAAHMASDMATFESAGVSGSK